MPAASIARGASSDVASVLDEIGANEIPTILAFNKIDTLPDAEPRIDRDADGVVTRVWLSAETGAGIDLLRQALADHFRGESLRQMVRLGPADGALRAWLFAHARVVSEAVTEQGGWEIEVEISRAQHRRYLSTMSVGRVGWSIKPSRSLPQAPPMPTRMVASVADQTKTVAIKMGPARTATKRLGHCRVELLQPRIDGCPSLLDIASMRRHLPHCAGRPVDGWLLTPATLPTPDAETLWPGTSRVAATKTPGAEAPVIRGRLT
jgi:hypothetical protein